MASTLTDILKVADEAYPNGLIARYADDLDGDYGDTLARFIVVELREAVDGADSRIGQFAEAVIAIKRGSHELRDVAEALHDARMEG